MINSIKKENSTSYGISDTGLVRKNNEDYFYFDDNIGLFMVADGMGGHNSGEVASEEAVIFLKNELSENEINNHIGNIKTYVEDKILKAHQCILKMAEENTQHTGMGSTIVIIIKKQNIIHMWHIGDSRAYLINKESINQLGTDHSYVAEMVKKGLMTEDEAWQSDLKSKITMALGVPFEIIPEYVKYTIEKNDRIVLCSDGLNDMLRDDEIKEIVLENNSAKNITKALFKRAMESGGKDNITIITHIN